MQFRFLPESALLFPKETYAFMRFEAIRGIFHQKARFEALKLETGLGIGLGKERP
jgi:hypothetical protein